MIRRILVPMIGSDLAEQVFATSLYFAVAHEAVLDLLYAIDISGTPPRVPMAGLLATSSRIMEALTHDRDRAEQEGTEMAHLVIEGFTSRCRREGVKVHSSVAPGYPGEEILRRQRVADLVCMENPGVGVHRRHIRGTQRLLARITRLAARPILFVAGGFREIRRVLVAYDGSLQATRALKVLADITSDTAPFRITLLTMTGDRKQGRARLDEALEYLGHHGIEATPILEPETGGEALLKKAVDLDVQLIVAGAFGQNRLEDHVFGSTTEHLLTWSELPLLICS